MKHRPASVGRFFCVYTSVGIAHPKQWMYLPVLCYKKKANAGDGRWNG